ncbi:MAG: high frequency lysogenization protein HflD [Candidatus Competibacteraceae bacterium]
MSRTDHDQVIALAALLQASSLVRSIATTGQMDCGAFAACLGSLLKIDADSSEAVYGGMANLHLGLRLLCDHLQYPRDMEITRYVINLLVLERKLAKRPELLQKIRTGIESNLARLQQVAGTDPALPADLTELDRLAADFAELYTTTVSTLAPRILVNGKPLYLTNPANQSRIRALLLAGIRAAVLWRQKGGGRLTLLFRRTALLAEGRRLLARLS